MNLISGSIHALQNYFSYDSAIENLNNCTKYTFSTLKKTPECVKQIADLIPQQLIEKGGIIKTNIITNLNTDCIVTSALHTVEDCQKNYEAEKEAISYHRTVAVTACVVTTGLIVTGLIVYKYMKKQPASQPVSTHTSHSKKAKKEKSSKPTLELTQHATKKAETTYKKAESSNFTSEPALLKLNPISSLSSCSVSQEKSYEEMIAEEHEKIRLRVMREAGIKL